MTAVLLVILIVLVGLHAFFHSRSERLKADARIEARFERSVQRAKLGLPVIPISEIYDKEKY